MRNLFIAALLGVLLCVPAHADGFALAKSGGGTYFTPETKQMAFISHENNLQDMLITVSLKARSSGFVWLFPVPSGPNDVVIDIIDAPRPKFVGYDTLKQGKERADAVRISLIASAFFTLYMSNVILDEAEIKSLESIPKYPVGALDLASAGEPFTVHKSVVKFGVHTELLTGSDEGIAEYLKGKGYDFPEEVEGILQYYINEGYSFVTAWGNPEDENSDEDGWTNANPAIKVVFPSKDIYYPMKPTSVYGAEVIPVEIYIIDWVAAKDWTSRPMYLPRNFEYYGPLKTVGYPTVPGHYRYLKNNNRLTRIKFENSAFLYHADIWLVHDRNPRLQRAFDMIVNYKRIFWIYFFILASFSGVVTGLLVFPWQGKNLNLLWFWVFGLLVALTILAVIVGVIIYCRKKKHSFKTGLTFVLLYFFMYVGMSELCQIFLFRVV